MTFHHGTEETHPFNMDLQAKSESTLDKAYREHEEALESAVMMDCLRIANEIPGIEYETFEDYLEHAERIHLIVTRRNWQALKGLDGN